MRHTRRDGPACSRTRYRFADGYMHPGEAPGLGVDHRRGRWRRAIPTRGLPAGQPPRGRHRSRLVGRHPCRACPGSPSAHARQHPGGEEERGRDQVSDVQRPAATSVDACSPCPPSPRACLEDVRGRQGECDRTGPAGQHLHRERRRRTAAARTGSPTPAPPPTGRTRRMRAAGRCRRPIRTAAGWPERRERRAQRQQVEVVRQHEGQHREAVDAGDGRSLNTPTMIAISSPAGRTGAMKRFRMMPDSVTSLRRPRAWDGPLAAAQDAPQDDARPLRYMIPRRGHALAGTCSGKPQTSR